MKYKLLATFSLLCLPTIAIAGGPNQEPRGAMEEDVREFGQESQGTFGQEYRGDINEDLRGETEHDARAAMIEDEFPAVEQMNDSQIASKLQVINDLETRLGNLALQKTQNTEIRNFAQRLVRDHESSNSRLEEIASSASIEVEDRQLSSKHQQIVSKLQGLSGAEFDRTFLNDMNQSHTESVEFLRKAERTSRTPELKEYLASLIPTIEQHRSTVSSLQKNVSQ